MHTMISKTDQLKLSESRQGDIDHNPALLSKSDHKRPRSRSEDFGPIHQQNGQRPGLRRSRSVVSFNDTETVHVFQASSQQEREEFWYSSKDFSTFRNDNMVEARMVARRTKSGNQAVLTTLEKCYAHEEAPCDVTIKGLQQFLDKHQCAGLERFTSRQLFRDKRDRRRKLVEILDEVQELYFDRSDEFRSKLLSRALEKISRPSVLFAQSLARAQSCKF